jgi:hypothetical protein
MDIYTRKFDLIEESIKKLSGYIQHSQIYIYTLSLSVLDVKCFHNVRKRAGICSGIFTSPTVR